jgi:HEAT repeat protein
MIRRAASVALAALVLALPGSARAQFGRRYVPPPPHVVQRPDEQAQQRESPQNETNVPLRSRFGTDRAEALLRTGKGEDVRRGVAQADQTNDELTIIDLARALAPFAKQDAPRQKLVALLDASARPVHAGGEDRSARTNATFTAHVDFARRIAARALVASRDPKALDAVESAARESGAGQENALRALASDPGASTDVSIAPPTSASAVRALAQTGDLRVLDVLLAKAQMPAASTHGGIPAGDATTRAASLVALGQLGDGRARMVAIASFADRDAEVRAAAGEALVLLDAPERFRAVEQLLSSPDTIDAGVRLAHRAQDEGVVKALAARFAATNDRDLRLDILAALGRGIATDEGLKVLASVAGDPRLGGDAVQSIARSPNPHATATLERLARVPALRRLAVRGYVLRALLRGERSGSLDRVVDDLRASRTPADRALATFARVALGRQSAEDSLADGDASVRRAAAMGSLAAWDGRRLPEADALLRRWVREPDEATRAVLAVGLLDGDPRALVPTLALETRVDAGGADAPISAAALAARKGDALKDKIDGLLASSDPVMRAHVARGLGASEEKSATGRLADATRYEAEPLVRLAEIEALARRAPAPARNEMLSVTARFDPEARIRDVAARALAGAAPPAPWPVREVAWLRVATTGGAAPAQPMLATYVTSEGLAIPIAFDADGYALVPGIPPGDGRVVLSPVVPKR